MAATEQKHTKTIKREKTSRDNTDSTKTETATTTAIYQCNKHLRLRPHGAISGLDILVAMFSICSILSCQKQRMSNLSGPFVN